MIGGGPPKEGRHALGVFARNPPDFRRIAVGTRRDPHQKIGADFAAPKIAAPPVSRPAAPSLPSVGMTRKKPPNTSGCRRVFRGMRQALQAFRKSQAGEGPDVVGGECEENGDA